MHAVSYKLKIVFWCTIALLFTERDILYLKKNKKKFLKFAFFVVIKVHDVLLIVHAQQK